MGLTLYLIIVETWNGITEDFFFDVLSPREVMR